MVQLEAMACGKPVVSANLPSGVPWVNQHEETGLIVEPGDVEALAAALNRLLDDPAARERMGQAGRARVKAHITLRAMATATHAVYRDAVGTPGVARDRAVSVRAGGDA